MVPTRNCEEPAAPPDIRNPRIRLVPRIVEDPVVVDAPDRRPVTTFVLGAAAILALLSTLGGGLVASGSPAYAMALVPGTSQCPMSGTPAL